MTFQMDNEEVKEKLDSFRLQMENAAARRRAFYHKKSFVCNPVVWEYTKQLLGYTETK